MFGHDQFAVSVNWEANFALQGHYINYKYVDQRLPKLFVHAVVCRKLVLCSWVFAIGRCRAREKEDKIQPVTHSLCGLF